ncbi:hypothetical protein DFP85_12747 [Halomonas ventosae]|uniref:Phasin protein n=1 Tax=Halomonas ventosae TaxID=229007 RepID=A0A4V6PYJ7_9GAMM|nr:hypothetical protein [Halomonas ventosae]TDR50286.1 hypothetical protein DFP85_12747 [Halomonas ventosae]
MSTARHIVAEQVVPASVVSVPAPSVGHGPSPMSTVEASLPVCDWWLHHWMDATHPMIRLQQAWMASLVEAFQLEAEFLSVCTMAGSRVVSCLADQRALQNPPVLGSCCQDAAKEVADAHAARVGRVARLPKEFRQRLWEEIC